VFTCRRVASLLTIAATLGLSACGEGVVLPDEGAPATITVVSGDTQVGSAGAVLSQPLVVRVTDSRQRPVANQTVGFAIEAGGGQVAPSSTATDADGLASATWTLGAAAGQQRLRAQATGNGAPANLGVSFTAGAQSGAPGRLELVSGDGQIGSVGTALAEPLVVRVTDALGNPVGGVTVAWSVSGGGSIEPASAESGTDGLVRAERVLGPQAGPQSAQATVDGLDASPVTFTHSADASVPTSLVRVSGDNQTAPAGFQLPDSLVVRLVDDNGNGVGGRTVTWVVPSGAGVVSPVNAVTTADGYAVTRWTLGPAVGSFTLNAVFSGLPSVPFTATSTPDVPTTIAILSGDGQVGAVGSMLPAPLRVKVTDANGNGVENVSVTWTAVGGGSVSSTTTGTDGQGIAQVNRTLGGTPGTYTTTAEVAGLAGSPLTFSATANVGPAARLAWVVQPADAVVGQTLPAMQVEIQDAQGNRVTGASNLVTITAPAGAGLDGDDDENASGGVATFNALRLTRAGNFQLTARASGLANDVSRAVAIAKGGTSVAIVSRSPTTSLVGQLVTISYQVTVSAPAEGSPGGTVRVSDGDQSCNGGVSSGSGTGSCQIAFNDAGTHTITAEYLGDANFNGSTSAEQSHTVNKADATITITGDDPDPSSVGQTVNVEFTVTNTQGGGSPTGTVTVTDGSVTNTCPVADGTCPIALTAAGDRTITATYSGDANFNGDADTESHSVRLPSTTTVTTSDGSTVFGETVTFTATVTSTPPGSGTPAGSVQFRADGQAFGGAVPLSGGTATRSTNQLSVGSHVITAEYTPNGQTFAGSTGTLNPNQQVGKAGTTTGITDVSPEPSNPGESYTVSVTVQPVPPGGGTPDGTVSISDGQGGSCTASLGGGGSGSCDLSSSAPGAKTLTATYNGSASYDGSSTTAAHSVNTPPTANNDSFSGSTLFPISSGEPGVLGNDTDPDGPSGLTAALDSGPSNGVVQLNPNGSFVYTPNLGFLGTDSFTYHANDGRANSASATVTLQVGP
jgi:large repetitive protein